MSNPSYLRHDGTRVEFTLTKGGSIPRYESPDATAVSIIGHSGDRWEAYHISDPSIDGHGPTPQFALDCFCSELRHRHDVAVALGLLPPETTPEQRAAMVEELVAAADEVGECRALVMEAVPLNADEQQRRAALLTEARMDFRALAEKAMGVKP
ncbi:MAG: hypothetical protein EBQ92_00870 [Proteobacteria bacterium]|nr:hypothetical protein [Pseudomonadota bacterium]